MNIEKKGKVKISDIAQKCDVSLTTISRFFNRPALLSEATRAKIENAIKEMDYTQDNLARILVTGKSNLIGVVFPHLHTGFYTELLSQLIEQGKQKKYNFITYTSNTSKEDELEIVKNLFTYRIKGLILLSPLLPASEIEQFPVPVISVERAGGKFMQINNDNFSGGKFAAELLIKNKCEVIVHINNDYSEMWPSFKRIIGFECAVVGKYPYERIINKDLTDPVSPAATAAMEKIFDFVIEKYPNKKIGVFCSNDDIANMFERQCIIHHVRLPEQIELIGYDNSPVSENAVYPITSIEQNIPLMAQIAVDAFDNYIAYESVVPSQLIEKSTTSK
ncbi:MAG: LacI family DNA-binding transcriptional regulator [Eubacteriales bacterium]|nr:LacI family DNA-binding transcriptional regulator [Eubacteriales bacterium]